MKFALILPARNPGAQFGQWLAALAEQETPPAQVLVIDSQSSDHTADKARQQGYQVHGISVQEFNHGATRNLGVTLLDDDIDIAVFMTQDALLHTPQALGTLVAAFAHPNVAAAYGRQLPHENANPLAAHARLFNYPRESALKSRHDIDRLGIKTAFLSNAFAAYRIETFKALGGFPENIILGEDMHLAARIILAGYDIAYCADAQVRHSHNYSARQEMRRYFDIGVFHSQTPWLGENFGRASGEGRRFVLSEWRYLLRHAPHWLPAALLATLGKWSGYQLGRRWQKLPATWRSALSMHKRYWQQENNTKTYKNGFHK